MSAIRAIEASRLLALVGGNWTTQAIGAAVRLGLVERLARRAASAAALARATGSHAPSLARLLLALEGLDVVRRDGEGRYALTPMGALLRAGAPGSVRGWALWCSGAQWRLWADLDESVRTGRSARLRAGGKAGYAHLDRDPEAAAIFNEAMAGLTRRVGSEVARRVDWRGVRRVVDVGGGYGELLAEVLAARPGLEGLVFDLPHAVQGASARLAKAGLARRARVASGSFFEAVPAGADAYLLKSILHNWDDERAAAILRACRAAMAPGARLVVVERVLPERPRGGRRERAVLRSDLNMLVSLGGRERTRREFAALLREAGFSPPRVRPTATDYCLIEARPAAGKADPAR